MSPGVQNAKTGPDALGTVENESGCEKHENVTRCPRYGKKRVRGRKTWKKERTSSVPSKTSSGAQNIKSGPDAIDTAKNESGSAKHEKGSGRRLYR
jgi:hypothetical protein